MATLEQIILEQNESSNLDFKATQYKKGKFEDFLVDIISMANADTNNSKYIVVGVKAHANGEKQLIGINETFVDEATYQQLINENIEPDIKLDYFSLVIKDVTLGVFHLSDCQDPPYMLKKDYGKLKKGDSFIRKGSHQTRLTRKDINRILLLINERQNRIDDIQVTTIINNEKTQEIQPIENLRFPSDAAAEEIKQILKEKEDLIANTRHLSPLIDIDIQQIGGTPYRNRSTKTLKKNLADVKDTYKEDDHYYLLETMAFKLNFELLNTGSSYLEDASIEVEIEEAEGLLISSKIVKKPDNRSWPDKINRPVIASGFDHIHHPSVTKQNGNCTIFETIGNLKHLIPAMAFKTPVRFVLAKKYQPDHLVFKIKIFGKTFRKPLEKSLELKIRKA